MTIRLLIGGILLALIACTGCAQRDTTVGSKAISASPADTFVVTSGQARASASFKPRFTNGGGKSLEVGDARGMFAYTALQFDYTTNMPDSFRIDSVRLRLYRNRIWPARGVTAILARVRAITENWTEGALLPGSLPGREGYPILDSVLASTVDSTFSFEVPASLFNRWFAKDTTAHGLLIEPASPGAFIEYYSRTAALDSFPQYPPRLIVHGEQWILNPDSTWRDTAFSSERFATDDGYLVNDSAQQAPGRIFLTQGMPQRLALFFPLDTLNRVFSREINRAELHLFTDSLDPANVLYEGGLYVSPGILSDTLWIANRDSAHLGIEDSTYGIWDTQNSEVIINVSNEAAGWLLTPAHNGGVQIRGTDELGLLSRMVFHSSTSEDSTKRPKLVIWYTESSQ